MINCFLGGLSFVLVGYAFAFGSGNIFIGYSHFLILDLDPSGFAFFFFQVQKYPWISLSVHSLQTFQPKFSTDQFLKYTFENE